MSRIEESTFCLNVFFKRHLCGSMNISFSHKRTVLVLFTTDLNLFNYLDIFYIIGYTSNAFKRCKSSVGFGTCRDKRVNSGESLFLTGERQARL